MIKEKDLLKVLENVIDPEIGINIVDLGLIYDIKVEKDSVKIKMGLTSPFCPLANYLVEMVKNAVKNSGIKNVDVELVLNPPWTPERMSKKARKILGL
ncbi:MAG: metal-sulfur cluster assembly factor [Candidatus Aenigmatarchaeota archaeon]